MALLGYVIHKDGISVDPKKVEAVMDWKRLSTVREIQSILFFIKYYQSFLQDFSWLATPFTRLARKRARFTWTKAHEQSFQ